MSQGGINIPVTIDASQGVASMTEFVNSVSQMATKAGQEVDKAIGKPVTKSVEMDFTGVEKVNQAMRDVDASVAKIRAALKGTNVEFGRTPNEVRKSLSALKELRNNTVKFKGTTNELSPAWIKVTADIKRATAAAQKMGAEIKKVETNSKKAGQSSGLFDNMFTKFVGVQTAANLATTAIQAVGRAVIQMAQTGFEMEMLSLQLEAFTGSAEGAEQAMERFGEIAGKTPFDVKQVAQAGKIMMAFGMETDAAVTATERLSVAAAATGGDLNLLARNMGQIVAQGRAYTRDLTQFAIQGIPIWEQLSIVTGESVATLKEMAREGKIGGAEVTAAFRNMTAAGSQYAEIANRMQETFAGRFALIQSEVQLLALEFITTFNDIDRALGLPVANGMKAFAEGLSWLRENFDQVAVISISAAGAIGLFVLAMNAGAIWNFIAGIGAAIVKQGIYIVSVIKTIGVLTTLQFLMGNVAVVALAIGAGVAIYNGLSEAVAGTAGEMEDLRVSSEAATGAVDKLGKTEEKLIRRNNKDLADKYKRAREAADEAREALDAQVAVLERMKKKIEETYNTKINASKKAIASARADIEQERAEYERLKAQIEATYKPKIDAAREALELARQENAKEIERLQARTPAEQRLLDFERQQLEAKVSKGGLDREEQLRAEARLSRMQRTAELEKVSKANKKEETELSETLNNLEQEKSDKLEAYENKYKAFERKKKDFITEERQSIRELEDARERVLKPINDAIEGSKEIGIQTDIGTVAVNNQISAVEALTVKWQLAAQASAEAAANAREANEAASGQSGGGDSSGGDSGSGSSGGGTGGSGGGGSSDGGFTGGWIEKGISTIVNEIGQEAFLSAAGHLSKIQAGAWGQWTAPSSGTIIPAHIARGMNIPAAGVNINNSASARVDRAGQEGGALSRALAGLAPGSSDRITNNVTIQSDNTTQAASDMLVQLNKIRRRRLG